MRFTSKRHRYRGRPRAPRIAISQDEITADLHYPGGEPSRTSADTTMRRGRR